jgi:DNA-binding NtrC family response regulator
MEPRVILYEPATNGEPSLMTLLPACGCKALATATAEELVDAVTRDPSQVVLFALAPDRPDDLVTLRLLRRVAPDLPLVIVTTEATLEVRRIIQTLRPGYFSVRPVDAEELHDALCAACPDPRKERRGTGRHARAAKPVHRPGAAPA